MSVAFQVRNANPPWRRWLRRLRQWRGAGMVKTHQVHIVSINGERFKRVTFARPEEAIAVSSGLKCVSALRRFPAPVALDGCQVWTEYVPGGLATGSDRERVVDFFAALYRFNATRVGTHTTDFPARLIADLDFLVEADVIASRLADQLKRAGGELQPQFVLLGHDYVDPVLKNFVISDGLAVGIDIEALVGDLPLGYGLAKARLRWLGHADDNVLRRLDGPQGAAVRQQYPWVRLCFLASYFRQKVLQRKPGLIQVAALAEFVAQKKAPPGGGAF
ncbi:MAG: hypothetical protein ACNA7J_08940 [Wenzhouxiangella sp.]